MTMSDSIATSIPAEEHLAEAELEVLEILDDADDVARTRRWQRKRHGSMLWISASVVALAFLMQVQDGTRVAFRGLEDYPLPELCGSRAMFNVECPGCGLTRSILSLARGDWEASLSYHRIGWILALAIVLQIPYRIYRLRELKTGISEARWPVWFGNCLIALLLINWLTDAFFG